MNTRKFLKCVSAVCIAGSVTVSGFAGAGTSSQTQSSQVISSAKISADQANLHLTEGDLAAIGLTRQDAEEIMNEMESQILTLKYSGDISEDDANILLGSIVASREDSNSSGSETRCCGS